MTSSLPHWLLALGLLGSGAALAQEPGNPDPEPLAAQDPAAGSEAPDTIPVEPLQAESAPAPLPEDSAPARLDDVVVTATKRAETERDIPLSIDSYKGRELEQQGAIGLEQILQSSPGVNINKDSSADKNYVSIRGVSSDSRNNIYTRPTGLFLDDTSLTNPSTLSVLADVDPYDLYRVEILKGPQGTLFGGSALSGAIRYIPNPPNLGVTQVRVLGGLGWMEDSQTRATTYAATLNVPLGDTFAVRAAGVHRETPGFLDDTTSGERDINGVTAEQLRAAALWQVTPELSAQVSYFLREVDAPSGGAIDNPQERTVSNRVNPSFTRSQVDLADVRLEYDLGFARLVGLYNLLKIDGVSQSDLSPTLGLDGLPVRAYQPYVSAVEQDSWELRLVSAEPAWFGWNYLVGAYQMTSDQLLQTQTTVSALNPVIDRLPPAVLDALEALVQRLVPIRSLDAVSSDVNIVAVAQETAGFVDLSNTFFEDWTLNLGGRYYDQRTDGRSSGAVSGFAYGDAVPVTALAGVEIHQPEEGFNPKIALTWKPGDSFSAYASAVKGFRFGGINTVDATYSLLLDIPVTFKSDHLWNYEAGIRTDWFDGRLLVDLTGFYIDWTDMQILQLKAGVFGYTDNVGGARSKGVELDMKALLPWNFFASLGGAYVDARTTETFVDASGDEIPPGTPLPATPEYSASAMLSHRGTLFGVSVVSTWSTTYKSNSPNALANDLPLDGYTLHNASINLGLRQWDFQPEVNFSVTNLFDAHATVFALDAVGGPVFVANQPRTILLTVGFSY